MLLKRDRIELENLAEGDNAERFINKNAPLFFLKLIKRWTSRRGETGVRAWDYSWVIEARKDIRAKKEVREAKCSLLRVLMLVSPSRRQPTGEIRPSTKVFYTRVDLHVGCPPGRHR